MVAGIKGAAHERIGQRLGRYELRYLVAQGGMASVYLAQMAGAHEFERWVAIKVMHSHLVDDEGGFIDMFLDEARLAARIQHPNVCQVIDFGEENGTHYIVMEYLHGETLSALIKRAWTDHGALSPVLVAAIVAMIARGLHAAHELRGRDRQPLQVIHRDVSPQNMIVLYDGMAKITDFGIARARGRLSSTQAGMLKGKFAYMSPEQLNGEDIDRRSDIWALGVVLWEASLGRHLFRSRSEGETAIKVVQGTIARPSELVEHYPQELEDIIMNILVRDREARVTSSEALATRLEEFCRNQKYEHWGPAEIAEYLATVFPDRLRQREDMLSADLDEFDDGITVVDLHSSSTMSSRVKARDLASIDIDLDAVGDIDLPPEAVTPTQPAPSGRPWWAFPAIALGLVIGLTVGALMYMLLSRPSDERPAVAQLPTVGPEATTRVGASETEDPTIGVPADVEAPSQAVPAGEPVEVGPVEVEPVEVEPVEVEPVEVEPVEVEPVEVEPVEVEPSAEAPPPPVVDPPIEVEAPTAEPREPLTLPTPSPPSEPRASPRERETPTERPRERARPAGEGTLNLLAIPRAEVRWRGRMIGHTPLINYRMPAGRHRLVLTATDGSGRRTIRVNIENGERTSQSVSLAQ